MKTKPLTNADGSVVRCMHTHCHRPAVRVIGHEDPNHFEFYGQTHDCCAKHSKGKP